MDADLKAKQAQAKRAELMFKLKQSELKAAGGAHEPQGTQVTALRQALLFMQLCVTREL